MGIPRVARFLALAARSARLSLTLVLAALLCATCTSAPSQTGTTLPSSPSVAATTTPDPFGWIDAAAARRVATAVKLVDAYNAADIAAVLALLAPEVGWTDCAGDTFVTTNGHARAATIPYFQARFADHDRLEIGQITTAPCNGGDCVGIRFARRSNDSLRALGFPNGIVWPLTNKTVFDANSLVRAFANASGPQDCHPK